MKKEIWKEIPGYGNRYQASTLGRIKSLVFKKERILKLSKDRHGYLNVSLSKNKKRKNFRVHKLIAITFLNHVPNGHVTVIDHIDNDKLKNQLLNLQEITNRENCSKDRKNGTSKYPGVSWHKQHKKWRSLIRINGKQKHLGYFETELEAYAVYRNTIPNHFYNTTVEDQREMESDGLVPF